MQDVIRQMVLGGLGPQKVVDLVGEAEVERISAELTFQVLETGDYFLEFELRAPGARLYGELEVFINGRLLVLSRVSGGFVHIRFTRDDDYLPFVLIEGDEMEIRLNGAPIMLGTMQHV